jgi:hypothetical protein
MFGDCHTVAGYLLGLHYFALLGALGKLKLAADVCLLAVKYFLSVRLFGRS